MVLVVHAAAVSLAATHAAVVRARRPFALRHALFPHLVDARAMSFERDAAAYARLRGAVASHIRGDESGVILSCSVYNGFAPRLSDDLGVPVERSDDAGARRVLRHGNRIGLAVSYPPSYPVVEAHLAALAAAQGRALDVVPLLAENAFAFADDAPRYARVLVDAIERATAIDAAFLAQYSMDPHAPLVAEATRVPVVSALEATLAAR